MQLDTRRFLRHASSYLGLLTGVWNMKFLTEQEAAEYLRVEVITMKNWRWRGKGPRAIKMRGLRRAPVYDQVDLDAFVESLRGPSVQANMENRNGLVSQTR
jgi:hypothetical protein